jgi:hypothetical protein
MFKIKVIIAKLRILAQKLHKEALKLALAVVVLEYLIAGGWYIMETRGVLEFLKPKTIIIEINKAQAQEPKPQEVKKIEVESIADIIYKLESSNGKNDQKCERLGKHNGHGFAQRVNKNFCLASDEKMRVLVIEWIKDKQDKGMTTKELLCYYNTGTVSENCEYIKNIEI